MYTSGSVAWSCIRTRSPSSAPPEKGDDGSTASTPTRLSVARSAFTIAEVDVDLPTPGEPVMPTIWAFPVYGASPAITSRSSGEASSTREMSLATARASPSLARSTRSGTEAANPLRERPPPPAEAARREGELTPVTLCSSGAWHSYDQRVTLAATTAQGGSTGAAATTLQLEREVQYDPGAGHADRVAHRYRAAVDVDLVLGQTELTGRGDSDRGEGLVDLEQVEVGCRDAFLLASFRDRVCRLHLQSGVGPGDLARSTDLRQPLETELLGLGLAHHHDRARAVGDLRGGAGSDGAVLGEGGTELAKRLRGGVGTDPLVLGDNDRFTAALRDLDRDNLVVEHAILPGLRGALVRAG